MQRYCIEAQVAAQKIRTTYGSEWLINETSLASLIDKEPVINVVASDANTPDTALPATPVAQINRLHEPVSDATSATGVALVPEETVPEGERRTIADVLIANARLIAQVEGKDAIIDELKEDRSFLREAAPGTAQASPCGPHLHELIVQ